MGVLVIFDAFCGLLGVFGDFWGFFVGVLVIFDVFCGFFGVFGGFCCVYFFGSALIFSDIG